MADESLADRLGMTERLIMSAARERLLELRREATEIIGLIDTTDLPKPSRPDGTVQLRGAMWEVGTSEKWRRYWTIHALVDEQDIVAIHTPDGFPGSPGEPGDIVALSIEQARHLAMAILAACSWQDSRRTWQDGRQRPTVEGE